MSENIFIDKNMSDEEIYKCLIPQVEALLIEDEPIISNLANFTAALKDAFDKISWVGFYFLKNGTLYLGPFQGKPACSQIKHGSGVCGTSAAEMKVIIVDDVNKFPGHIACDPGSKSEIVLPVIWNNKLVGVLDLDSYDYNSFNEMDAEYLSKLISIIYGKLDFSNFSIE
ncbi:MAG: GAF domain-containing protein [Melioribacteraceae bacterium]|nr:GAF domain-containing protein [Melioribacteraceae bacterium]MCF8355653.1 GAF domain-containing protein [Melioribacteraceae bacterium]MCF8395145.1 GAF domain-containing protein [Melioribacteraceae bacterium]MCF8420561.1 GAF domain-containing protein [Melioribacteraceae bacterium]